MGAIFTETEAGARPFPSFYEVQAIAKADRSVLPRRSTPPPDATAAAPAIQQAQPSVQVAPRQQQHYEVYDVDSHSSSSCESNFSYDSSDDESWAGASERSLLASASRRKYGDWDRLLTAIDIAFEADASGSSSSMRKRGSMSSDHDYNAAVKKARFSGSSSSGGSFAASCHKPEYYSSAHIADEPSYLKQAVMPLMRAQSLGRRGPRGQSRYKGVCITRAGKWRAVIYIGRKQKYLGVFDTEIEAAHAYDESAREHFGAGAKLNFTSVPGQAVLWRCSSAEALAAATNRGFSAQQGLCA